MLVARLAVGGGHEGRDALLAGGPAAVATGSLLSDPLVLGRLHGENPSLGAPARASAERTATEAILAALPFLGRLSALRGAADAEGDHLALAVEARTGAAAAIPWELLAGQLGIAHVVRVAERGDARATRDASAGEVRTWVVQPDQPGPAAIAATTRDAIASCRRLVAPGAGAESAGEGTLLLVTVVAPTRESLLDALAAAEAERDGGGRGQLASLAVALAHADLAVAVVAGGGEPGAAGVGAELVARGALLGVDLAGGTAPAAAAGFLAAVHQAVDRGSDVLAAVEAGRRALAAMDAPSVEGRWFAPRAYVRSLAVLEEPPKLLARARPPEFPPGSPAAEGVLADALELAERHGWLGVEQLADALSRCPATEPVLQGARSLFGGLSARVPAPDRAAATPRPSLRVIDIAARLGDGWSPGDLAREILSVPWVARRTASVETGRVAPDSLPSLAPARVHGPVRLEVIGGPEDGKRFVLSGTGQALGRHDPDAPAREALFATGPADRTVSRRHVSWSSPGCIRVFGPTWLLRGEGESVEVSGTVRLQLGDRVRLGGGTWLEVV